MKGKTKLIGLMAGIVAVVVVVFIVYTNTASFQRSWKSVKSDFGNGLNREVIVYDAVGNELYHQTGKFDIEFYDDRIMYDDENGNRHNIYFKTGTVIVNELD